MTFRAAIRFGGTAGSVSATFATVALSANQCEIQARNGDRAG